MKYHCEQIYKSLINTIRYAVTSLWREWRAGEWLVVCFALLIAITATTAIHFYTDRLMNGLDKQGAALLGGDLVVSSSTPIPTEWILKTQQLKLDTAQVWSYLSVVSTNNQSQLVSLQAVSNNYPLLGEKLLHLEPRTTWVEARLLPLLSINVDNEITIGAKKFVVKKILSGDIDTLSADFIIAPRVLMRLDDVSATRTVLPGSRVDYRLLMIGDKLTLQQFKDWITPQLQSNQTLLDVHSQHFALQNILQRTENYLQLILLVCLLMSGVAISLSIQQYMRRHYSQIALWRCLGASQRQIVSVFFIQLLIIAFSMGFLGIIMGCVAQEVFVYIFADFTRFPLSALGISPIIMGFITSNLILFAFSYPLISELPRISPLHLWRNQVSVNTWRSKFNLVISFLSILLLISYFMNFSTLSAYFFLILLCGIFFLYAISQLFLYALRIAANHLNGTIKRGISQLIQHPKSIALQFIGFNLILIAILISGYVRSDLIKNWQQSLPKNAPNYFAFNISRSDIMPVEQFYHQRHVSIEGLYPMVRGRLIALNGKPILTAVPPEAVNNNALHRDLNLSWMWEFPSDNTIVKGIPWTLDAKNKPFVSVEYKLAQDLHLNLGDELTFQIGDKKFSAMITSFRNVVWASIHPNFFMIFSPGLLDAFPATYITSFHLESKQKWILNDLIKLFPNVTTIDMASILLQLQSLVSKIIIAMQYLFLFALGLGVLIFMASLQATLDERRQTYSLLHILGADKKFIRRSLMVEFFTLGVVIVITAASFSFVSVIFLESYLFASS